MANSKPDIALRTREALRSLSVTSHDTLLVAVSGGIDSMSMLHVLASLRDSREVRSVQAVHVNHQLRGEASEADERLVRKTCESLNVSLEVRRVDTAEDSRAQKVGLEEAARDARYPVFQDAAKTAGASFVITAHTANDQAETIIMNVVRGAGLRGLSGIPASRSLGSATVLRPWLSITRDEIVQYADLNRIVYSEDATNSELTFQRNRVRQTVLPALQQAFPERDVLSALGSLGLRMRELDRFVLSAARDALAIAKTAGGLQLDALARLPIEIACEVVELWLHEVYGRFRFAAAERERLSGILSSRGGKWQLRSDLTLIADRGELRREAAADSFEPMEIQLGTHCTLRHGSLAASKADDVVLDNDHLYVEPDRLGALLLRPWRDGDRIEPFGMPGQHKLISDLLTDAGLSSDRKASYPVIEDTAKGAILWVPGVRTAEETRRGSEVAADGLIELVWRTIDEQ